MINSRTKFKNDGEQTPQLECSLGFQDEIVEIEEVLKDQEFLWGQSSTRPRESTSNRLYVQCDICNCMFKGVRVLREHKKNAHGKKAVCTKCNGSFSSQASLSKHDRRMHAEKK